MHRLSLLAIQTFFLWIFFFEGAGVVDVRLRGGEGKGVIGLRVQGYGVGEGKNFMGLRA